MKREKKQKKTVSIRWKLALYIGLFLGLVLLVTWVFQIILLDRFFEQIKRDELEKVSKKITEAIETDGISDVAKDSMEEYAIYTQVFRVDTEELVDVLDVHQTDNPGLFLGQSRFLELYSLAKENGGSYLTRATMLGGVSMDERKPEVAPPGENRNDYRLLFVSVVEKGEIEYLVLLNSDMLPVDSTVHTLKTQFVFTVIILVFLAAGMVLIMYRRISKPIIRMNHAAKQLAKGKYDAEFSGEGYKETKELADTLNYAAKELSRVENLRKELIANVSHDLRTPLTMIRGYGEVMRDIPGENTPENVQVIIDEATRLTNLVNDLLDLSKIQSGVERIKSERFDLTEALEEVMKRYDTLIRHRGFQMLLEAEEHIFVRADREMLLQVLYNLINNAVNYTGADKTVTVLQTVSGNKVRVSVKDTGEGIPPDQMPLIWDRYYKVDKVHKQATVGTGIGLSIVKNILDLHGAAYGVNSALGSGSTFWFEIPVDSET